MDKSEQTTITSFAIPETLFQKVRFISRSEDLNLSILFRRMVREWVRKYEIKKGKEVDFMNH
jgi:hypothetical protein